MKTLRNFCGLLALLAPLLLMGVPALAQPPVAAHPIDNSTQLGTSYDLGAGSLFCGIDYRIELMELFDNWMLNEDPANTTPAQMHPLRSGMLEYMAPFREHPAMLERTALDNKYEGHVSFEKVAVSLGNIPALGISFDWHSLLSPAGQESIPSIEEYNRDIDTFVLALSDFVIETDYMVWCRDRHSEYLEVVNELSKSTDDAAIILDMLADNSFAGRNVFLIPSPMITPGRNYMTVPSLELALPIVHFFGPYKLTTEGMFQYSSWKECEISFNSRKQFIQLAIHELSHVGITNVVHKTFKGREDEFSELLDPLGPLLERGYGPLPERALTYVDEMITRARTLECYRRYLGESDFRLMLAFEAFHSRGYAIFMWRYFYLENDCLGEPEKFAGLLDGLPDEMKTWQQKGLDNFASYNEHSMTLKGWFREFIPMFYSDESPNFCFVCPDAAEAEWCELFMQQLVNRLNIPAEMPIVNSGEAYPFRIELVKCDNAELLRRASMAGLDCTELKILLDEPDGRHDIAVIHKDSEPGEGVTVTWFVSSGTANFQSVVPYYFPNATDIIVADGRVLAMDSFTAEIKQVMSWFESE